MATHSVRRHLRVEIAAYDAMIRRFTPGYETMLEVITGALTASGPDHVLDLGAGTGALSEAILAHDGAQTVELIDLDPEMLDQARRRLERFDGGVRFREMSFRLRLAGRGEKIHEKVCRYGGRVPIREVWRARAMTAAVRRVLGLSETLGTCASSASNETRRS